MLKKTIKVILVLFCNIIIFFLYLAFEQSQRFKYKLFPEPKFTVGNYNKVRLDTTFNQDTVGTFYVYIQKDKDNPYGFVNDMVIAPLIFYPTDTTNPLKHDTTYYYYFKKEDDIVGSNMVFSTQDTAVPKLDRLPKLNTKLHNNKWYKYDTISFNLAVSDSAGIDSVFISRILNDTSFFFGECFLPRDAEGQLVDTTSQPDSTIVDIASFNVLFEEDGNYDLIFGAKDAAHAAESCSSHWKLDGNKCFFSDTVFSFSVDRAPPYSKITSPSSNRVYIRNPIITINFYADDSPKDSFESGLNYVSLYYSYRLNPSHLYDREFELFNDPFKVDPSEKENVIPGNFEFKCMKGEGWYEITTLAKDIAIWDESDTVWKEIVFDKTEPILDSLIVMDTSRVASKYESPIVVHHWTNDTTVSIEIHASDGISGLKSAILVGNVEETFLFKDNSFGSCSLCTLIYLSNKNQNNSIYCYVRDKADYQSNMLNWEIEYDSILPILDSIKIYDLDGEKYRDKTDSNLIKFTIYPNEKEKYLHQFMLLEDGLYNFIVSKNRWDIRDSNFFDFPPVPVFDTLRIKEKMKPGDTIIVHCALKDFAGNVSEIKSDSILYLPNIPFEIGLTCYDQIDIDDSDYSNNPEVRVHLDSDFPLNYIDTVWLSQYKDFSKQVKWTNPGVGDTLFTFDTLGIGDNFYSLYGTAINVYGKMSDTTIAEIFLDFTPPNLDGVTVKDIYRNDTTFISDINSSRAMLRGDYDNCPDIIQWICLSEFPALIDTSKNKYKWKANSTYPVPISTKAGKKRFSAVSIDWAENISDTVISQEITYNPDGDHEFYNIPNPFDPINQPVTEIIILTEKFSDNVEVWLYDVFGNYVDKAEPVITNSRQHVFHWNGKNKNGDLVADGVYLGIIEINKNTKKKPLKIVVKKNKIIK